MASLRGLAAEGGTDLAIEVGKGFDDANDVDGMVPGEVPDMVVGGVDACSCSGAGEFMEESPC